jgi:hypothetical protein
MVNQAKRRARASMYVLSTALIALGTASLSALPSPAKAEQATAPTVPPPCPCLPGSMQGVTNGSQPAQTAAAATSESVPPMGLYFCGYNGRYFYCGNIK